MDRFSCYSIVLCAAFIVLSSHFSSAQTVHVVGDSMGWAIPSNPSSSYANWATGRTFVVGDILQFNFMTNAHDVVRVPQASYNACSDDDEIGNVITTGPANITLTSVGDHYYICTFGTHCQAGQRLAVSVVASSTPGLRTAPPTIPAAPSPASTQPGACEPTPSNARGPGAGMTPPPSLQGSAASTSSAVAFLLSALSIGIALFF